ncbi:PepSY domain-containing protein, partial [Neisseria gonorrhoeae]|uniref:PepSY domain-containing protein n=1 Tax=Neisseria gonorrhoeae TaxID=485 RepID=UPI0039BE1351
PPPPPPAPPGLTPPPPPPPQPAKHQKTPPPPHPQTGAWARVGGKITDIDLEHDDGRPHYDVEIVKNGQEYKVVVDARTGRVISSRRDD